MERRAATWPGPHHVELAKRWEAAVHRPGMYDLQVDTSLLSPEEAVDRIKTRLSAGPG
jgi:chloramphenicol 3-O phosphotransferase